VLVRFDGKVLTNPTNEEAAGRARRPATAPRKASSTWWWWVLDRRDCLRLSTVPPRDCAPSSSTGRPSAVRRARAPSSATYLGFPLGVGGAELCIRALEQAWSFGAETSVLRAATGLRVEGDLRVLMLADGTEIAPAPCCWPPGHGTSASASPARGARRFRGLLRRRGHRSAGNGGSARSRHRRRQLRGPGGDPSGQTREARDDARPRRCARGEHVRVSREGDRGQSDDRRAAPHHGDRRPGDRAAGESGAAQARPPGETWTVRRLRCSSSSAPSRTPSGCPRASSAIRMGSSSPARTRRRCRGRTASAGHRFRSRPACPACSRPGTCGMARSSAWPPRSGRRDQHSAGSPVPGRPAFGVILQGRLSLRGRDDRVLRLRAPLPPALARTWLPDDTRLHSSPGLPPRPMLTQQRASHRSLRRTLPNPEHHAGSTTRFPSPARRSHRRSGLT
jgi:hypothetical protein